MDNEEYHKAVFASLKPGDVLFNPNMGKELKSVVLKKTEKGLFLSVFCQEPLMVEMPNSPFRWDETQQRVVDKDGQGMEVLTSIQIQRNVYPKIKGEYNRISRPRHIAPKTVRLLQEKHIIPRAEINALLVRDQPFMRKMSLILNRVFGPEGYTEKQLVLMTELLLVHENIIREQQGIIRELDNVLKETDEIMAEDLQYAMEDFQALMGHPYGSA